MEPLHRIFDVGETRSVVGNAEDVEHGNRIVAVGQSSDVVGYPKDVEHGTGATNHYPRSGHHHRFKNPLHCRILNRQWHTDSDGGLTSLPVLKNRH